MKKKFTACLLVALMSLGIGNSALAMKAEATEDMRRAISQNKIWTISFDENVSPRAIEDHIRVEDYTGREQELDIKQGANSKEIYVIPEDKYREGRTYLMIIDKEFLNSAGTKVSEDFIMGFETDDDKKLDLWIDDKGKDYDDEDISGDVYVKADNVSLEDTDIDGRLYIDAGINGETDLDDVEARRLVIVSAKDDGITMEDCDFERIDGDTDKIKDYDGDNNNDDDDDDDDDVIIGKIERIKIEKSEITLDIETRNYDDDEDEYVVKVSKSNDAYDDIKDEDFEEDDIVKIYSDKSGRTYDLKSMEMLIEDDNYEKNPVYCVIDNDDDEIELGFGEDKDTHYDDYDKNKSVKMDKAKNMAEMLFGESDLDEGDFVQIHVNEKDDIDAIGLAFINTKFDDDYYAEKSPSGDIADDAFMKVIDTYERSGKTYVKLESENGHEYKAEATGDAEDMIDDNDIDDGDFVKIEYDYDDEEVTDFEVIIEADADVYKVVDIDSDLVEIGFDSSVNTDADEFDSKEKENYDKSNDYLEFGRITEDDFVVVKVDEDGEMEAVALVDKPKKLASKAPKKGGDDDDDDDDDMIVYVKDIDRYEIEVEDEDGDRYTLDAVDDAKDLIKRDKLDEKSVISMEWDKGDKEISDFKVLIKAFDDDDDDVYKVIDIGKTSMELGFDDDPDTDIDDFRSSDKEEVDMDRSAEMFRDPDEGDFVKVYMDDDEIKAVLKVSEPDELADEAPED